MPKKMAFSDHTLKKLIKEVRKRECLWNPDHDRYNDRYQMAKAWAEIADLMELPEDRLRVKWKNLRDLFKKEIKKFGSEENYTGKWRHFDVLKFVNKPTQNAAKKAIACNKNNDESNFEAKEEVEDDDDFVFEVEEEHETEEENNEVEVYLGESFEEDPIPDKRTKLSTDEDYDVMFLKSLAPYFRQLDPIRKLVVRSKMQDMLLNEIAAQTSASHFNSKNS